METKIKTSKLIALLLNWTAFGKKHAQKALLIVPLSGALHTNWTWWLIISTVSAWIATNILQSWWSVSLPKKTSTVQDDPCELAGKCYIFNRKHCVQDYWRTRQYPRMCKGLDQASITAAYYVVSGTKDGKVTRRLRHIHPFSLKLYTYSLSLSLQRRYSTTAHLP